MSDFIEFSFTRRVAFAVLALVSLFVALDAPPADQLDWTAAIGYWLLHIGFGVGAALLATGWLVVALAPVVDRPGPRLLSTLLSMDRSSQVRGWLVVLAGGTLGSWLFAALAIPLENIFAISDVAEDDTDWLDEWELRGGIWAWFAEWLHLYPGYIFSWMLLNAGPLLAGSRRSLPATFAETLHPLPGRDSIETRQPAADIENTGIAPALRPWLHEDPPAGGNVEPAAAPLSERIHAEPQPEEGALPLPHLVGNELVVIRSDLHYLEIVTKRGAVTMLGNLSSVAERLKSRGMLVHRSYWVAFDEIDHVIRGPQGWQCVLSTGHRVPISRRRVAEARQTFGHKFDGRRSAL